MKCEKCKKECSESELIEGYCYECRNKYKDDEYNKNNSELSEIINKISKENIDELRNFRNQSSMWDNEEDNPTVEKLKFIINAIWILGVIFAIVLCIYLMEQGMIVTGIIAMIVVPFFTWLSTIVLESFKEIIVLLQDLKNK